MPLSANYNNGDSLSAADFNDVVTAVNNSVTSGGALGTPSSGTLTNCTGLPATAITATGTASSSTYLRGDGQWTDIGISTGKAIAMAIVFG